MDQATFSSGIEPETVLKLVGNEEVKIDTIDDANKKKVKESIHIPGFGFGHKHLVAVLELLASHLSPRSGTLIHMTHPTWNY